MQQPAPEDSQARQRRADGLNAENRMLFFAKVLRSATDDEVRALFAQFGKVHEVNLFRAFQGAPTTKGCGLVTMGTHDEAVTAIEALDSKFTWEGMDSTMVVKWMDVAMQRRRREQHLAAVRQGLVPSLNHLGPDWRMPLGPGGFMLGGLPSHPHMGLAGPSGLIAHDTENPPVGCDPDAIKLFVGNLPRSCTEQQLLQLFETIGKVVELVIVRDKATQEPKGSAFVWYATRAFAERAILQFNLRHCLPDPAGEQDRPLVVRKAKARTTAVHPSVGLLAADAMAQQLIDFSSMGPLGLPPPHAQGSLLHYNTAHLAQSMMGHGLDGMQPGGGPLGMVGPSQPPHLGMGPPQHHLGMGMMNPLGGYKGPGGQQGGSGGGMGRMHGGQGGMQEHGMYEYDAAGHGGVGGGSVDGAEGFGMPGGSGQSGQVAVSIAVNQQQMSTVNAYLFSVQTMSGAQLSITPGAPGLFHMVVTGNVMQVENARSLLNSLLNSTT